MTDYQYETLLPPNHSELERHLEMVIRRRFDALPIDVIRQFWRPEQCPAHLLPHLARQFSVDVWREEWPEERKRAVIAASPQLHRIKGTRAAIELALESYGQAFELTEWWESAAQAIPGYTPENCTAWLEIDGETWVESGIELADIVQAIKMCKRLTLHIGIMLKLKISGQDYRETIAFMPKLTGGDTAIVMELKPKTTIGVFMMLKEAA